MKFILYLAFIFSTFSLFPLEFVDQPGVEKRFLQTEEDHRRLGMYAARLQFAQNKKHPEGEIPKILHFIWLGPKPFPNSSIENLKSWIKWHPEWKINLWTDHKRSLSIPRVEEYFLEDFPLQNLKEIYYRCTNFGERSEILRYAILFALGGIYVDHDVFCLKSLNALQEGYDFFCGLEPLGPSILSSSVNPSPHLIAAAPRHPILQSTISWLQKEWERLETFYPGEDPSSVFNRVQHRSFRALGMGIEQNKSQRKDAVFPPKFFSLQDKNLAEYSIHKHLGTWHSAPTESELKIQNLLTQAKGEQEKHFFLILGLVLTNLVIGALFFCQRKKTP